MHQRFPRPTGNCAHEYADQIEELGPTLGYGWQTRPSRSNGNPMCTRPSVLVLYRDDRKFSLYTIIPKPGRVFETYDLIIASQPWRARTSAECKARRVLGPLVCSFTAGGCLLAMQSWGQDPGLEIIHRLWPDETPFLVNRHPLISESRRELGREVREFATPVLPDEKVVFRYDMHTLPSEIGNQIGTSTLFAARNAAIYVNQIEDGRLDAIVTNGAYLEATQSVSTKTWWPVVQ